MTSWTLLPPPPSTAVKTSQAISSILLSSATKNEEKQEILKTLLRKGDYSFTFLIPIIQGVCTVKNKSVRQLAWLWFEGVEKVDSTGKLREEMILVW